MRQHTKQRGMVLLIVLLLMQVLALLSWFATQAVIFQQKMIEQEWQHQTLLQTAKVILVQVEEDVANHVPLCLHTLIHPDKLLAKPLAWWRSSATCAGNFQSFEYYYVVESVGNDACANLTNQSVTVDYFRITVLVKPNKTKHKIYLQSTLIKASKIVQPCIGLQHQVTLGRQTWRELT